MKKVIIIFAFLAVFLVFSSTPILAQDQITEPFAKHSIYVEGLGNGFLYSVNYEYHFSPNWSLRAGMGTFEASQQTNNGGRLIAHLVSMPILLNFKAGFVNHKLELSAGLLYLHSYSLSGNIDGVNNFRVESGYSMRFGYLYYPFAGGLNFRIAYTPLLTETFSHSFGVGIGYGF